MAHTEQGTPRPSPYWIGDDKADDFAELGSSLIRAAHEARPRYPGRETVNLKLLTTDDFEAYTRFENGTSTIQFSRGWITTVDAGKSARLHGKT